MSSAIQLPVSSNPGEIWRVGYAPDPWEWTPWQYAQDDHRFNGRWDDEHGRFRTIYTSISLLGCFLELLAPLRPNDLAYAELAEIVDDAATTHQRAAPERGAIGRTWLESRLWACGIQTGTYVEITQAEALSAMVTAGIFARLGIPPRDVDTALLKDATRRDVTRSIARWAFDLQDSATRLPAVDGIAFRSRMGDDIRLWAAFERADTAVSEHITPNGPYVPVVEDTADLLRAFDLLDLHWRSDD